MTDIDGYPYTLTRTFDVPADVVWAAWTTPDQYAEWANAVPGSVEMDVRPAGVWKAVMVTPEGDFPLTGSYLEVEVNERLVTGMDIPGRPEPATMEMELEERGEQTRLVLTQVCDSAEERDMAEEGSNMLLDGLSDFLADS